MSERTPPGRGGVSVVYLAGREGRAALARLVGAAAVARLADGVPRVVRLVGSGGSVAGVSGALLDVALAVDRGADGVELHLHGSPPLVRAVLRALDAAPSAGIRVVAPCVEERATALLARAASEAAARMLLDQAEGALRRELTRLVPASPERWRARLAEVAARGRVAARLVTPPRVVLAGPVNAGKSTLFNALLGRRRVVESGEAGTTRDAIAEPCRLGAYAVELVDTAGERDVAEARRGPAAGAADVERAGQALARELRRAADLVLWLDPGGPGGGAPRGPGAVAGPSPLPVVVLASRGDRAIAGRGAGGGAAAGPPGALRPREDPLGARAVVEQAFHAALALPRDPWTPGAGVPLGPADAAALAALARADASGGVSTAVRWRALREVLGPAPLGATPARR